MKFPHALALLVTASIAAQQEIWVEPVNGNDGNPATYGQPLRTLTAEHVWTGRSESGNPD